MLMHGNTNILILQGFENYCVLIIVVYGAVMSGSLTEPEARLLRECLEGSAAAWTELYDRYSGLVRYRLTKRFNPLWSQEDVEDLTQAVFMDLIPALERFDRTYSLSQLVCGVADRRAHAELRRQFAAKRKATTVSVNASEESSGPIQVADTNSPDPEDLLIREQLNSLLRKAMRSLGEQCRRLLRLYYFDGKSINAIAEGLGEKANTVAVRKKRCIDELRDTGRKLVKEGSER